MFGQNFSLDLLVNVIKEVKPSCVSLGAHYYVQLAESELLDQVDPKDLDSIKLLCPAGSAVPSSCGINILKKFRNLEGVMNAYGQTEYGLVSAGFANGHLGTIFPKCTIKIEDPDTGKCKGNA